MEPHPIDLTKRYGLPMQPVSLEPNISPEYFERERDVIFRHAWLNVGRTHDIPNIGDYLVKEMHILRTSVLVVRGRDGQIRAFHNMCRHRGNKLCATGSESGNARGFSCAFHGWTYDPEGQLVIVPDEDQFFNLEKKELGLTQFSVGIWEGFIFINAAPKESLRDWLGEMYDRFDGYFDNPDLKRISCYRADVRVNWKVVLDAFVEAYHAPFLHGKAYPDQISWEGNRLAHLLGAEMFERHRVLSIEGNPSHNPSPIEKELLKHSNDVFTLLTRPGDEFANLPRGINPTRDKNWAFDINVIFPNFYLAAMTVMPLVSYHFWPVAVDRTIWQTDHYMLAPKHAGDLLAQQYSKVFARDVQREDLITLENTQSMLASGAMKEMVLSDQEVAVRHGYQVVEDMLKSGGDHA